MDFFMDLKKNKIKKKEKRNGVNEMETWKSDARCVNSW